MKPAQYFRGALKVPGQRAKAGRLGKAALHHPTSGQEDEALLGFGRLFTTTNSIPAFLASPSACLPV